MEVDYYESLPEGIGKDELAPIYDQLIYDLERDSYEILAKKLDVMCDKQWHTYELPDSQIQEKLGDWIVDNWKMEDDFFELALGICYCFGLEKALYKKALDLFNGKQKEEFESNLARSKGEYIDPYWSMRSL